jgi:hypothetical protein
MHWEEYGIFIKRSEYAEWQKNHRDMPTPAQISRRCGGFNKAKELAGLVPSRVLGRTIDDEEIYKALYDCSKDLGKTKFSENDGLSLSVLRRFSGGYEDAVKKALIKYIEKKQ